MKIFLFYMLLLLIGLSSQAQQVIKGKVKTTDGDSALTEFRF